MAPFSQPNASTSGSEDGERVLPDDLTRIVGHDRQIVVVGRNLAGYVTAGFLDHAGLSPVLVEGSNNRLASEVIPIWRSGLELLERIGIRRSVEAIGRSLNVLRSTKPSQTRGETDSSQPWLVAVPTERLVSLLDRQLADRIRVLNWGVESVHHIEQGIQVSFEQGVTETFDALVTTDRTFITQGHPTEQPTPVHVWEFDWPAAVTAPDAPVEAWAEDFAAFTIPTNERVRTILVADRSAVPTMPLALNRLAEQFGGLISALGPAITELDESTIQYRRLPHSVPVNWTADNVALLGPALHASIPGDCLGPALTIEDSWVLADALTYGPSPVENALDAYVDRRHRRLATMEAFRRDADGTRVSGTLSGVTRQVCARRSLAFGHLLDSDVGDLARDITD